MLILRPIEESDLSALVDLAEQLDSMNLPANRDFLQRRIETSQASFAAEQDPEKRGIYVFVLIDTEAARCIGTCTILAKHGRPDAPYFWLAVTSEERRSAELDKRLVHTRLQLKSTTDGPTEIGGLILDPRYRRHPLKCGKALSTVRFAYISMYPERFEREVIAEMLSPFEETGANLLWDAFGKKFTQMEYREADHLSSHTKQFIADLFPRDPVYVSLFPDKVQEVIGQPNATAVAALRILEKIGFRSLNQVDPFDGGPYYGASRDAISSVRERRTLVLPGEVSRSDPSPDSPLALLSAVGRFGFRATVVPMSEDGSPFVSHEAREILGVDAGDGVSVTPLP